MTKLSAGEDAEQLDLSYIVGENAQWRCLFWKTVLSVSYIVKNMLTLWPSNPTPKHLPRKIKTYVHPQIFCLPPPLLPGPKSRTPRAPNADRTRQTDMRRPLPPNHKTLCNLYSGFINI